jgi:hypothetical protein
MRVSRIFSVILLTMPPLFSDTESKRVKQWLKTDKNSDGVLTIDETSGLMRRFFNRNDRDGDGKLTKEELGKLDARLKQNPRNGEQRRRPEAALVEGVTVKKIKSTAVGMIVGNWMFIYPKKKHQKVAAPD